MRREAPLPLPPTSADPAAQPLVFGWDPETGDLDRPGAKTIRVRIRRESVVPHPIPRGGAEAGKEDGLTNSRGPDRSRSRGGPDDDHGL